jgi:protein LSM14
MPSAPANQQQPQPQQQQQQQQQQSRQDSSQNGQRRPSAPLQQQRQGTPRGQTQGNVIVAQPLEIPSGEYDFAAANSKFEKPSEAEAEKPAEPSYNKTSSFFDTLSSESQQRATYQQQVSGEAGAGAGRGRNMRGQERAMNYETFGEDLQFTSGSRGGRRGRGRGGRGRGRGTQQQSQ